ncbi:MAG: hypothetical protein K2Y14_02875 [Burkholderiales bacterium]|nr:hypothetical protein [Burkholderiales bacterium]
MIKFLLIGIGILSISSSSANEIESYKTNFSSGTKLSNPVLPILNLHGSYHEMGEQYGALMKSELQLLHQKVVPDYYKWYTWTGLKSILITVYYHFKIDQREKDLLTGISLTLGLSYFQTLEVATLPIVMLLNGVINSMDSATPDLGNCSFAAVWGSQSASKSTLVARNLDLFKQVKPLDEYSLLTIFHPNNGDNKLAAFSFVDFIPGFTWVSERGIFVEYNNGQRSVAGINPLGFLNLNLNFYGLLTEPVKIIV